ALEALSTRQGVCQDFAHILIACLRSLGLAARYVSGYLLTQVPEGQERLIGADASHAWASVYLPELSHSACAGWLDLDPTNDRWGWGGPGPDYVVLAWGRDFADVSPLRGVLQGGQSHALNVGVSVKPDESHVAGLPT
ncbi:MAG: transglutaminase-like domain-containing protein, partial [Limnohabitans sp.]